MAGRVRLHPGGFQSRQSESLAIAVGGEVGHSGCRFRTVRLADCSVARRRLTRLVPPKLVGSDPEGVRGKDQEGRAWPGRHFPRRSRRQ